MSSTTASPQYARLLRLVEEQRCVVLDGGVATELERARPEDRRFASDLGLWGTWALYQSPYAVLDVHRRYVDAGCDVVSTDTWSILSAPELEQRAKVGGPLTHWMDVARLGIQLARQATAEAGRADDCAVAFTISEDVSTESRKGTIELLARVFAETPPDLILLETLSLIREELTFPTIELLLETGVPLWLSFRRCRHGVCGVFGQHWGPPEGDLFGRAARRFEEMGVGALLVNCLPVDHVPGMLPWLRDFVDMPLGVYPNLGYLSSTGWKFDERVGPPEYAQLALEWREEGAQIVGGCCGVGPEHIAAARAALERTRPGRKRATEPPPRSRLGELVRPGGHPVLEPLRDTVGRRVFPLPFPELAVDQGVFVPTQGSFLVWRHLFLHPEIGAGKRCADVGCGTGVLAVQLALNGAQSVLGIDIDKRAVANMLANAFRNGVADRVSGRQLDLYEWEPEERYDVVVASLYQMPVDPYEEYTGHRPLDFWGRNILDHFLRLLPKLLYPDGCAYVMQLSIMGHLQTAELLEEGGLRAEVVDFGFFPFGPLFQRNKEQIDRVEQLSDAYHLAFAGEDVMVAYLLRIAKAAPASPGP